MDIKTIHRYLSDECTEQERHKLEKWLKERSDNQKHFDLLKKIWNTEIEVPLDIDSREGFRKIQEKISQVQTEKPVSFRMLTESKSSSNAETKMPEYDEENTKKGFRVSHFYKIAAVLLVGIIGVGLIFHLLDKQGKVTDEFVYQDLPKIQSYETLRGEVIDFTLKKGFQVKMNTSSSIRVYSDAKKDQVTLNGEAFFDIERDKDDLKEFIVQSNSLTVSVIGTKFNVRNRAELQTTEVVVQKGIVQVSLVNQDNNFESIFLNEGEQLIFNENEKSYRVQDQVKMGDLLIWMNGGLVFQNTPLSGVLKSLERRYDIDFIIRETAALHRPFSARFTDEELPDILDITALTLGFEYEKIDENLFEIYNSTTSETVKN